MDDDCTPELPDSGEVAIDTTCSDNPGAITKPWNIKAEWTWQGYSVNPEVSTVGDYAGSSVSTAGDVDNDGYSDVLIGTTYANAAYLVLGSSGGIPDMSLSSVHAKFTGEKAYDGAGWPVATAGDVNGDGYADILIGAVEEDSGGTDAGAVYLIMGF